MKHTLLLIYDGLDVEVDAQDDDIAQGVPRATEV